MFSRLSYPITKQNHIMNNNTIRKFKTGKLYRNDKVPEALYMCVSAVTWDDKGNKKAFHNKSLVVLEDLGRDCKGHIVRTSAVKEWNWREV